MRKFSRAAAIALLISLLSTSASMAQPVVDGTKDADYGGARAVQTIQTGFGNNQSEWNAGYATVSATDLFLMLTGNLEDNFNKLEIFIDSVDSGTTNVYSNPQNNDGTAIMDGMTFDTGFTPDYHIIARHGAVGMDNRFDLDFIDR